MRQLLTSFFVACAALFLLSCSEKAQQPGRAFEGRIVQKITVNGNLFDHGGDSATSESPRTGPPVEKPLSGPSMTLTMFSKGDKVAYDMTTPIIPITLHSIVDRNARTVTILGPNKVAYVSDLHSFDKVRGKMDDSISTNHRMLDSLQAHMPKPTGNKKTIQGLACEEYKTTIDKTDITLWITQDSRLKYFDIMRDALLGKQRTGMGGLEELFSIFTPIAGDGHLPVIAEVSRGGKTIIKSEMVEFSEESVSDDVFEIPKGYEIDKDIKPAPKPVTAPEPVSPTPASPR